MLCQASKRLQIANKLQTRETLADQQFFLKCIFGSLLVIFLTFSWDSYNVYSQTVINSDRITRERFSFLFLMTESSIWFWSRFIFLNKSFIASTLTLPILTGMCWHRNHACFNTSIVLFFPIILDIF